MRKSYYIFAICILLAACTSRTIYKKPKDLIPKEQMIDLWVDIMVANGTNNVKNKNAERKINYMRFVYEKYQIDSVRFMRSNVYYTSKIEDYEKMFEEVSSRLKKLKETYAPFSDEIEDNDPRIPINKRDTLQMNKRRN